MINETSEELAARLVNAADAEGLAVSTFTKREFNNSRLVRRLREGGSVRPATYWKIVGVIGPPHPADNCPELNASQVFDRRADVTRRQAGRGRRLPLMALARRFWDRVLGRAA